MVDDRVPVPRLRLSRGDLVVDREMARATWVVPRAVFDARLVEAAQHGRRRRWCGTGSAPSPADDRSTASTPRQVVVGADGAALGGAPRPRAGARADGAWPCAATPRRPRPRRGAGHRLRHRAAAVLRLVLRPWRRPGQRRVRRAARGRAEAEPRAPARAARGAAARRDRGRPAGAATSCPCRPARAPPRPGRVLLVGDAAGLVNPMTGEGIYYAVATGLAAGRAAAEAIAAGDPAPPAPATRARPAAARPAPAAHRRRRRGSAARRGAGRGPARLRRATSASSTTWSSSAWPAAGSPPPSRAAWPASWSAARPDDTAPKETMSMRILSVHGVLPEHRYPQAEITEAFADHDAARRGRHAAVVERFHRNAGVDTRHLALPLERYARLDDFGESNDAFIEVGVELGARAVDRRAQGRRPDARRRRPDHLGHRHRPGRAVARRPGRRADRHAPRRRADAAGRPGLRGRRRRGRPAARLPARPPRQRRGADGGRAVLADAAARRRLGGQPGGQRAVRRRRRRRGRGGRGPRGRARRSAPPYRSPRCWPAAAGSTPTPSGRWAGTSAPAG